MSHLFAIGIGPGDTHLLTMQAREALEKCTAVAGYRPYLESLGELLAGKRLLEGQAMRQEVLRCTLALEAALAGETVAVVSSGDAGIYGMAGLLLELAQEERFMQVEVVVVPGVTAASSCAALVGAPFMNDFAVISLSDLMTPADLIRRRLEALAGVDLPVAIYNPASRGRHDLLEYAVAAFRQAGGNLPAAIVRDAYRPGQLVRLCRLDDFPFHLVQMTTLVIIGNSHTILNERSMFCQRGYRVRD